MDNRYSADTITIGEGDPAVVEQLNDILENAGHGRPLGAPSGSFGRRTVVPVSGAEPLSVCRVLQTAATAVEPRPQLAFYSGTNQSLDDAGRPIAESGGYGPAWTAAGHGPAPSIGKPVGHLVGADAGSAAPSIGEDVGHLAGPHPPVVPAIGNPVGHLVGHGLAYAELPEGFVPPQPMPEWKPPAEGLRRPVIALLDSDVRPHPALPDDPDDPFVLRSDDPSLDDPFPRPDLADGPKAGHATFMAGLIRFHAPSARVLSLPVMDGDGMVSEYGVVTATEWIERYREHHPVDVIVMPFGRPPGETGDDGTMAELYGPIDRLSRAGVAIVASAGNDHWWQPIFPAGFEQVIAVGAGFGDYHATFSNYGPWVDRQRDGVNALSVLPGGRWGRWSGTSFAAAVVAADLARPYVV
jgi:hypothetical protein